jgi:p-cumate 2,3-dioxygenase beta subunit
MGSRLASDPNAVTVQDVEQFLYHEAALLDEWRLTEWLDLLTEDAEYEVPATDAPADGLRSHLSLVYDDRPRIDARVKHYLSRMVCAESPASRVRRMISNVRIVEAPGEDLLRVCANFVIYRFQGQAMDTFVGRYDHLISTRDGTLKLRRRRAILDAQTLRAQGKLSIIL